VYGAAGVHGTAGLYGALRAAIDAAAIDAADIEAASPPSITASASRATSRTIFPIASTVSHRRGALAPAGLAPGPRQATTQLPS